MPEITGIEFASKVRSLLKEEFKIDLARQPLIMGVTGHAEEEFKKAGIDAGMDEVYPKPIHSKMVKQILQIEKRIINLEPRKSILMPKLNKIAAIFSKSHDNPA